MAFNSPFGKYEYIKVPLGLAQAPAYFQDLMTGILKDFNFAIAYLDDIIIFSRTAEEHLSHIKQVFGKLQAVKLSMKLSKCHFFSKEIQYLGHILSKKSIQPLPSKMQAIQKMHPPTTPKQVCAFIGLVGYYRKFIKDFVKIAKPLTLLTHQQMKFEWTPAHHEAFLKLKESIIQAPILCYLNPNKMFIVYTDASDDACSYPRITMVQSFQLPFSHTLFQEHKENVAQLNKKPYGVYYAIIKWNYYLQGADIIVRNAQKPLTKIWNGKNANNKVNRWGLELAAYNITFEWISGAHNKAADCLSCLVEFPQDTPIPINMLAVTTSNGPALNTKSQTHQHPSPDTSTSHPDITPEVSEVTDPTPKSLTADRLQALLQVQKTDPFCKRISKCLSNGKALWYEMDPFTHVRGLLYKHAMDSGQKFLALVIPKSWKYTVLVKVHDK